MILSNIPYWQVEYICPISGSWCEDQIPPSHSTLASAIQRAQSIHADRSTPARVIDESGETVYLVG